ncbi:helix-turn-helix domain-containing protein, partial [Planobispora siamensis]|uniref:helix-turn-helix domain-containing protein n=1 Tax=Planobispora siamensis TaxID=936338 RepID=UPI00194F1677
MLFRLAYLAVTNAFAALRLLPMSDRDKDVEILTLRHQITVLERQLGADTRVRFVSEDRAFLAALLTSLPREVLRRVRLLVRPDTVLRWHRDLMRRRHAHISKSRRLGRPPTVRSIRALILRLVRENPSWGYRRVHGELAMLGITVAPCTVWEILKQEGVDPAPERASVTWAGFLRSQAEALLACDFIETVTLTGQRQYILAVIEHASRRVRVLGTTAHPTAVWVVQAMKNLVMDLEEAGCRARYLIRDRDGKFPALMDEILTEAGIWTVLTGVRVPRMNAIMERWVQSCRRELLDRCLLWNERHLR